MKAFRFRADGVLEIRRRVRDAAQVRVAREELAMRGAALAVERAVEAVHAAEQAYAQVLRTSPDAGDFERHRNWIEELRRRLQHARAHREERARAVAQAREHLRVADRDVRVLERLRERAMARHQLAERREEMKALDEFAALQFGRRLVNEGGLHDR